MAFLTKIFVIVFMGLTLFQSCLVDFKTVKGNGTIVNEELVIEDYNEISISSFADVIYEQRTWDQPFLQISVDENILPFLDIKVKDEKLIIRSKDNTNISPTRFKVYTNSSILNKAKISGSGNMHLKGEINTDNIEIGISGSGTLATDSLYCDKFDLWISGSGKANLKGVCNNASFKISGSGKIMAFDYQVQDLKCTISGSGTMKIHVNNSINAAVSGSGNIKYRGNPHKIDQRVSGSGNVSKDY
jgi:hypothetical protein